MGCKEDNTCDQPATKGEIQGLRTVIVLVLIGVISNHLMWYARRD